MSLENVRQRLAADAKVAEVAEVFRCPVRPCAAAGAEVAEVAEVFGGRVAPAGGDDVHRLQRSCRGFSKTYAPATYSQFSTCEDRAEVAEVFHSLTRAQARAGEEKVGGGPLQAMQPMRAPRPVTILQHCRCSDCVNFSLVAGTYFCSEYIGGTRIEWATGKRSCDPPPHTWHYCASYHGPQISKDVWAWSKVTPQTSHVGPRANIADELASSTARTKDRDVVRRGVNGSFPGTYAEDRHGNSRAACLSLFPLKNQPATRASDRR